MMLEIQFLAWDMYIYVAGFNCLMGSHFEINTKYLFFNFGTYIKLIVFFIT